jgi:hypothetical protein
MKMNKRQQQIEDIRLELIRGYIKDDVVLYCQLSNISQKLWMLSHKLTWWQSFVVRCKRLF